MICWLILLLRLVLAALKSRRNLLLANLALRRSSNRPRPQPIFQATAFELERLRCALCGALFTAPAPPEAG
jgi:hypothetical protein